MADRKYKHKKISRTNERTTEAMISLINRNVRRWTEAGIIPPVQLLKVMMEESS